LIASLIRCNISTLDLNDNQIGAPVTTQAIKCLDIRDCPIDDDGLGSTSGGILPLVGLVSGGPLISSDIL
jgi:hypothetical protein